MIIKTIEFVPSDITTTIDSLQTDIANGKYDDILANFNFFTITEKGLTLVKQDKTIVTNATVDLSAYSTTATIDKKFESYALKTDIPDVSSYITADYLTTNEYITQTKLNEALAGLSTGGNTDLTGYVTTTDLETKLNDYAKTNDIPSLSGYATEDFVTTEIGKINIPDVSSFITENDVNTLLSNKSYATTTDLENYAKKSDVPDLTNYALKSDIPSNYLTISDLTDYAKKTDIPDVSAFITSIPDEYITESELTAKGYLTEHQSLEDYAKTEDLPTFEFDTDGTLIVTINGVSNRYTPEVTA